MAAEDQPQSLRSLWSTAEAARASLDTAPNALSQTYADTLASALDAYRQSHDLVAAASLFSPNETLDDISTQDLPFLLTDYYVAELLQKTPRLGPREKLLLLGEVRAAYESFLALADAYGLVGKGPHGKLLDRYKEDKERFSVVAGDAASKRDAKIANFKLGKEIGDKLAFLKREPRYVEEGDEELVRDVYLLDATSAVHSTFQALDSLNREIEMLAMAPDMPVGRAEELPDESLRIEHPSIRRGVKGPLLSKTGKPLQPFTLLPSRGDMARNVFRPGHNLPTMSIDEYLEEEKRRGNIIEGGGEQPKPGLDEDDMDAVDRETYKAREWDEFKDHNPRGAGNTLNKG